MIPSINRLFYLIGNSSLNSIISFLLFQGIRHMNSIMSENEELNTFANRKQMNNFSFESIQMALKESGLKLND